LGSSGERVRRIVERWALAVGFATDRGEGILRGSRLFEIICNGRRIITGERGVYSLYDKVAKRSAEIEGLEHRIGIAGQTRVRE